MSTAKVVTILHPSSAVNNIVNDASGNVTLGNNLAVTGTLTVAGSPITGGAINVQTFTSSGTWTKPSGYAAGSRVFIQAWGGGGSGGRNTQGNGGGGGAYNERWLTLSSMGSTETITVGAGGAALSANGTGLAGGTTTAGSWISTYGGGGGGKDGNGNNCGGGGGGQLSVGLQADDATTPGGGGAPWGQMPGGTGGVFGYGATAYGDPRKNNWMGGGGGATVISTYTAGYTVWGGGGGGASAINTAGGASSFGGAGGAGGTTGTAGAQPSGGGGGGTTGNSGAGGAGQVIITVFPA